MHRERERGPHTEARGLVWRHRKQESACVREIKVKRHAVCLLQLRSPQGTERYKKKGIECCDSERQRATPLTHNWCEGVGCQMSFGKPAMGRDSWKSRGKQGQVRRGLMIEGTGKVSKTWEHTHTQIYTCLMPFLQILIIFSLVTYA